MSTKRRGKTHGERRAPVGNDNAGRLRNRLAPWPVTDRWPVLLGSRLSLQYLDSVSRLCQNGYRQQFVDALDELLERDPHAFGVLQQRTLAVAGGRVEITPAHVADPDSDDAEMAKEIAADIQRRIDAIPHRARAFYAQVFSTLYYGAGANEILWRVDEDGWNVDGLGFIHSRRIAWPDQNDWSPHIWDQGAVNPMAYGQYPTENLFGLRVADYPGKFIFSTAQYRADYPTRDGLGRGIYPFMALKLIGARGAGIFVERFSNPWVLASYNTAEPMANSGPRAASQEDMDAGLEAAKLLGIGAISASLLPDSIKIALEGPAVKGSSGGMNHEKLIDLCNSEISKAVRGGTLTTDAGEKGARSLGEVHAEGDIRNARYDAVTFADSLREGLVWHLCHLNYPGYERLCPGVIVHVEQLGPEKLAARAKLFAEIGGEPSAKWLAEILGVKMADKEDPNDHPLAPLKPTDLFALSAAGNDLPTMIEALAGIAGVQLTPAIKSALAELDRDDAARLVQAIIGAAKQKSKGASEGGAAVDADGNHAEDAEPAEDAPEVKPPPKAGKPVKGKKPPPSKTKTKPPAKRGEPTFTAPEDAEDD